MEKQFDLKRADNGYIYSGGGTLLVFNEYDKVKLMQLITDDILAASERGEQVAVKIEITPKIQAYRAKEGECHA